MPEIVFAEEIPHNDSSARSSHLIYFGPDFSGNASDKTYVSPENWRSEFQGHTYWIADYNMDELRKGTLIIGGVTYKLMPETKIEIHRPTIPTGDVRVVNKDAGYINIRRIAEGLEIKIKSPILEELFKSCSIGQTEVYVDRSQTERVLLYRIKGPMQQAVSWPETGGYISVEREDSYLLASDANAWIWFTRIVGISEEKTLVIHGVFDIDQIKKVKAAVKFYTAEMFRRYKTPINCRVNFSYTEFETISVAAPIEGVSL